MTSEGIRKIIVFIFFTMVFASISLLITGFRFGIDNNVFHIPYVLRLASQPEFSNDAFYASLKYFTSLVWPVLRLVTTESNIYDVFRVANFISRASAFGAIQFLLRANSLTNIWGIITCMGVLSVTPWLVGYSVVGCHGLFINYFTHTEVTWPFVFLSLTLLSLRKTAASAAMTGAAFSINAFVGIWLIFVNSFSLLYDRQPLDFRRTVWSLVSFLLLASPTILWIALVAGSPDSKVSFSFIEYIRRYYSGHFLIEAATKTDMAALVLIYVSGLFAARFVPNSRYWIGVQLACLLVFLGGYPCPVFLTTDLFLICTYYDPPA